VSTLAEIRAAVDEYNALQKSDDITYREFERRQDDLVSTIMGSVPDLLAIAEAAEAMRTEIKNIPQTVMTHHMYDVVADYDKAAVKVKGEADSKPD
jgi:hypothetical protein